LFQQLKPKNALISLFSDDADTRNKLRLGTRTAYSSIIRRDRSSAPQQLLPHDLCFSRTGKRPEEPYNPDRKLLRSVANLFRVAHNYPITKLRNYQTRLTITDLQILYRSISPSTMSMLPIAATTSAMSRPSHI